MAEPEKEPGATGEELKDGEWVPAPRTEDIENLSDDAIEKAIQEGVLDLDRERQKAAIAQMTPKPRNADGSSQASEEVAEPGSDPGDEQPSGTETEGQEPKTEGTEDRHSQEFREELELQRLRNERLEAEVRRATYQRDNIAGEIGHLKSLLSKQRPASEEDPGSYRDTSTEAPVVDEDRRELRDELSNFRKERVQGVIRDTATHFETNVLPAQAERFKAIWGDDAAKELRGRFDQIVAKRAPEFKDDLDGTNPKRAQLAVETIAKSALADAQIEIIEARREAVQRERTTQAEKLKARKQDGDMAGKGRAAPKTSARAKTPDDLSDDELENAVQRSVINEVASRGR